MKPRALIWIIIILAVIAIGVFFAANDRDGKEAPEEVTFSGQITEVRSGGSTLLVRENAEISSQVFEVSVSDITQLSNQATDELATRGFLRPGFSVRVEGEVLSNEVVESELTMVNAQAVIVLDTPEVILYNPEINSTVESPLTVTGEARGTWFFEANLPVEIRDQAGNVLAQTGAQAQGEWMTTDYVPFEGTLSFNPGEEKNGTIVIMKDNPSGLPENADSRSFPIRFGEVFAEENVVNVYFGREVTGTDVVECDAVFAVEREIADTQAVARAALTELLKGPTEQEETAGYFTSIPEGVKIQSLRIENGTAHVDFSEELDRNVGGSCRVAGIWTQINETLKQFPTVDDVVISINGRTEDILQP